MTYVYVVMPMSLYTFVKSSQEYIYSAFHNIDCIKAASQDQSKLGLSND